MRRQQESPGQTQSRHSASITSFSQLSNVTLSFSFTVEQDIPVQGLKPAQVKVYDYYETGKHGAEGVSGSDCGELDSWRCLRAMETHSCPWHLSHCTPGRGTSDSPALSLFPSVFQTNLPYRSTVLPAPQVGYIGINGLLQIILNGSLLQTLGFLSLRIVSELVFTMPTAVLRK